MNADDSAVTASSAGDARNPDGAGDGMGRNVSGVPEGYFHDTQKTPKFRIHTLYVETFGGWDALKAENLPPCPLCGEPIRPGQYIISDGAHVSCLEAAR